MSAGQRGKPRAATSATAATPSLAFPISMGEAKVPWGEAWQCHSPVQASSPAAAGEVGEAAGRTRRGKPHPPNLATRASRSLTLPHRHRGGEVTLG